MPAQSITGNLRKHPCPEQSSVANLTGLAVHGEQDLLREVFGHRFATACPEERHELRAKEVEQRSEGFFVGELPGIVP